MSCAISIVEKYCKVDRMKTDKGNQGRFSFGDYIHIDDNCFFILY